MTTQYQQLAEPCFVPATLYTGRVGSAIARRRKFQYQSYVAPLEPSLLFVQNLDWFYPFSEPVRRKQPYPLCEYVEPLVDGLRQSMKLDWLVQQPEPTRRELSAPFGEMYGFPQWEAREPEFVTEFNITPEIPVRRIARETPWFCTPVLDPSIVAVAATGWNPVSPEIMPRREYRTEGECYHLAQPIIPEVLISSWFHQPPMPTRPRKQPQHQTLTEPLAPHLRVVPPYDWMFEASEIPVRRRPARFGDFSDNKYPLWDVPTEPDCPYEPPDTDDGEERTDNDPDDSGDYLPPTSEGSDYLPGSIDTCQ